MHMHGYKIHVTYPDANMPCSDTLAGAKLTVLIEDSEPRSIKIGSGGSLESIIAIQYHRIDENSYNNSALFNVNFLVRK